MEATAPTPKLDNLTFGVCVDGVMPDDSYEYPDPDSAMIAAMRLKSENPTALVTVCLWLP